MAEFASGSTITAQHHAALHLAHRWFAFLEAPGGDLEEHLKIFHPHVQLSGRRGEHLFAKDHASLSAWFSAVPDVISSHHIVHSNYATDDRGAGLLSMVVAYQAPSNTGTHGSIISYETRIEFGSAFPRFIMLDKTPILPNTRMHYQPSWATNRVLALIHGALAGLIEPDDGLANALGNDVLHVHAATEAVEGSQSYEALVTMISGKPECLRVARLQLRDDVKRSTPRIARTELISPR
jgi:hypothetical protein